MTIVQVARSPYRLEDDDGEFGCLEDGIGLLSDGNGDAQRGVNERTNVSDLLSRGWGEG
jgi:hypothetical protein